MSKKGWCNFKVPNKIVIEHEQHVKTEFRRYTTLEENEGSLWFESLVSLLGLLNRVKKKKRFI